MIHCQFKVTVPPAVEPISAAAVKHELNISGNDQDSKISRLITEARIAAEEYTNRSFINQTIVLQLDNFPQAPLPWWDGVREGSRNSMWSDRRWGYLPVDKDQSIELPRPPLQQISEFVWYGADNTLNTIQSASLLVNSISEPARVYPINDFWPTGSRSHMAVKITYVAGYGSSPHSVPSQVSSAIVTHIQDVLERPNASVKSEQIDNASVQYGDAFNSGASFGLRGGSDRILQNLKIIYTGV